MAIVIEAMTIMGRVITIREIVTRIATTTDQTIIIVVIATSIIIMETTITTLTIIATIIATIPHTIIVATKATTIIATIITSMIMVMGILITSQIMDPTAAISPILMVMDLPDISQVGTIITKDLSLQL